MAGVRCHRLTDLPSVRLRPHPSVQGSTLCTCTAHSWRQKWLPKVKIRWCNKMIAQHLMNFCGWLQVRGSQRYTPGQQRLKATHVARTEQCMCSVWLKLQELPA